MVSALIQAIGQRVQSGAPLLHQVEPWWGKHGRTGQKAREEAVSINLF